MDRTGDREGIVLGSTPFSRVSWGGIVAGAFATVGFGFILMSLGWAIGLSAAEPGAQGMQTFAWAQGVWAVISIVVATFFGAWVGVRASAIFDKTAAAIQGATVWAVSMVVAVAFTLWMGVMAAAAGAPAAAAVVSGQPQALQQMAPGADPQQAQPGVPPGQQAGQQQQAGEAALTAASTASWWYFISAALALGAGVLGGIAGAPSQERTGEPTRRRALRPTETTP